jgi:hypothetical protein
MTHFRGAVLLLVLSASPAFAAPKGGDVQPDRIAFGTVYVGATVEASFMVFEAGNDASIKLDVTAPKFVKVLNKSTHYQQFGKGNDFVCGSVEIAIDTATAGELKGEITVTLGKTTAKVPVSATVKPRRPGLSRILLVESPFTRYSTQDGTGFKVWTDLVNDSPLDVNYLLVSPGGKPVLRDLDLGKFDCVFLSSLGILAPTPEDIKRVRAYAEGGGCVVVAANHFFSNSVEKANAVLAGYGLEILDKEAGFQGRKDVTLEENSIDPELVKAGVKSLHFFRASPVVVTDVKTGRMLVQAEGIGQPGDGFVAIAKAGHGEVIAIGESLWWWWISDKQAKGTDNAKLLRWLLRPRRGA